MHKVTPAWPLKITNCLEIDSNLSVIATSPRKSRTCSTEPVHLALRCTCTETEVPNLISEIAGFTLTFPHPSSRRTRNERVLQLSIPLTRTILCLLCVTCFRTFPELNNTARTRVYLLLHPLINLNCFTFVSMGSILAISQASN
jgi:hypothetical protein